MNVTQQRKIVIPIDTLRFVEGSVLAIFEHRGNSRACLGIFNNREGKAKTNWLRKFFGISKYQAYAVSTFTQCRHQFDQTTEHTSQIHAFTLKYELDFHVLDAETVCIQFPNDPVFLLQEEIKRSVGDALKQKPWPQLVSGFRTLAQETLEEVVGGESRFQALNRYAGELGLKLIGLKMQRLLAGNDLEVDNAKNQADIDTQKFNIQRVLDRHRLNHEQDDMRQDELADLDHQNRIRALELEAAEETEFRELSLIRARHETDMYKRRTESALKMQEAMQQKFIECLGTLAANGSVNQVVDLFSGAQSLAAHSLYADPPPGGPPVQPRGIAAGKPGPEASGKRLSYDAVMTLLEHSYLQEGVQDAIAGLVRDLQSAEAEGDETRADKLRRSLLDLLQDHVKELPPASYQKLTEYLTAGAGTV